TSVQMGQAISGYVGHAGDEDWYRYELPNSGPPPLAAAPDDAGAADAGAAGTLEALDAGAAAAADAGAQKEPEKLALRIDVSAVGGVRVDLSVLTEAEAALFQAKSNAGSGLSLRNVGVRATDHVIYVVVKSSPNGTGKDLKRGFSSDTYYTLTVAPEEAGASA